MKYNKQTNLCVALLGKTTKKYYENLNLSNVNGKKKWKTLKPFFGNKIKGKSQIALVEDNDLITDGKKYQLKRLISFLSMLWPLSESSMGSYPLTTMIKVVS